MDGWESTSLAGDAADSFAEQILKDWGGALSVHLSQKGLRWLGCAGLFDVSQDKTYQNKPVPFWRVKEWIPWLERLRSSL